MSRRGASRRIPGEGVGDTTPVVGYLFFLEGGGRGTHKTAVALSFLRSFVVAGDPKFETIEVSLGGFRNEEGGETE